ncbi:MULTISPECIES: serine hydrolase [unclassified Micromonospora]
MYTREQLVARAMNHRPDLEPEESWAYSNTGFVLVGRIIERGVGRSLQQEDTNRIVCPLGLHHTPPGRSKRHTARPRHRGGASPRRPTLHSPVGAH